MTTVSVQDEVRAFFSAGRARRRALWLTYEFTARVFENALGWCFGRARVDVVHGVPLAQPPGPGYAAWRARWPGLFHPKLVVLLEGTRVVAGVGSANLTPGGLAGNLETLRFFSPDRDAEVLGGVRSFLERLRDRNVLSPKLETDEFIEALPRTMDTPLLSSIDEPLLQQVRRRVGRRGFDGLQIVSPINADAAGIVTSLRNGLAPAEVVLMTDFVRKGAVPLIDGVDRALGLERPAEGEEGVPVRDTHAKVFALCRGNTAHVLWGSANLSAAAWTRKAENLELLVHSRVTTQAWKRFRDGLPEGHAWIPAKPVKVKLAPELPRSSAWEPLHVVVEAGRITIEASRDGRHAFELRRGHAAQRLSLVFRKAMAELPVGQGRRLGLLSADPPRTLEWRAHGKRGDVAVIVLDPLAAGDEAQASLAEVLNAEFGGRAIEAEGQPDGKRQEQKADADGEDATLPEDEELDACEHMGELDRFVLQWRALAERLRRASQGNAALRNARARRVMRLVRTDAQDHPERWSRAKVTFVERLMGGPDGARP